MPGWSGAGGLRGWQGVRVARLAGRFGRARWRLWRGLWRGVDAEHVAERAEDAAGLGGGLEKFPHVGVGQQVLEWAGAAGGLVAHDVDEPGAAGGDS